MFEKTKTSNANDTGRWLESVEYALHDSTKYGQVLSSFEQICCKTCKFSPCVHWITDFPGNKCTSAADVKAFNRRIWAVFYMWRPLQMTYLETSVWVFTSYNSFPFYAKREITMLHHISRVICIFIWFMNTLMEDRERFFCSEAWPEPQFLG